MTVAILTQAILDNLQTLSELLVVKSTILPEFIGGLQHAAIITDIEANNFDSIIDFADTAEDFAAEVIRWIVAYIHNKKNDLSDRIFVSKLFVSYVSLAHACGRVAEIYDSKSVDLDYLCVYAIDS